jgi:hypothetical protein
MSEDTKMFGTNTRFQQLALPSCVRSFVVTMLAELKTNVEYQHTLFEEQRCGSEISVLTGEI